MIFNLNKLLSHLGHLELNVDIKIFLGGDTKS